MMEFIHIKNLEKYHSGYQDRQLSWAKIHFKMVHGDPEFMLIDNEIDKWRFVALIILELSAQKPLPNNDNYWKMYFDIKKRPMSLTLHMLHNFFSSVDECVDIPTQECSIEKSRIEKNRVEERESRTSPSHPPFVFLNEEQLTILNNEFSEATIKDYIQRLNDYAAQIGEVKFKKYKSHVATIRNWLRRDNVKPKVSNLTPSEIVDRYTVKK